MGIFYIFLFLIFLLIIVPILTGLFFLYLAKMGLDILDFSSLNAILLLLLAAIGSFVNIPLGKKGMVQVTESRFFGFSRRIVWRPQGISINVGGALLPLLIAGYFLLQVPIEPLLITTAVVTFFAFLGARFVKEKGILISLALPVLFSSFFAILLAPEYATQVAFSSGVLGVLIGADLIHLPWILRKNGGVMVIGGAGIFDGIFLVGIISALLTAI